MGAIRQSLAAKRWILLSVALALSSCQDNDYRGIRNRNSQGTTVVCFGDSLTEGVGAEKGEDYPSVLARRLSYPVINAGRRGDTSADALARLEAEVLRHNPRLVIVLLGGNDFSQRVPLDQTEKNLAQIIERVQASGAMVALVGLRLGLFTDEYGPLYKDLAARHGALLVPDALQGVLSDPKLSSDRIHPNGAGYRLLAERVFRAVKPLLSEAALRG
ncbi:MAG TPA: arylesterase [Candidatus Acidoferrales bacterium]|nr:arylesterase [Candidatus Acidoferrales bacterium]